MEVDLQRGVEGELKGLILLLTHWVRASAEFVLISKPHEYWRWLDHTISYTKFKTEMRASSRLTYFCHPRNAERPPPCRDAPVCTTREHALREGHTVSSTLLAIS